MSCLTIRGTSHLLRGQTRQNDPQRGHQPLSCRQRAHSSLASDPAHHLERCLPRRRGRCSSLRNTRPSPPQWPVVALSSGAFIVWLYAIGGPFVHFPSIYDPIVGSLLVLAWTFFIPYIYDPQCDLFEGFNRRRRAIKLPPHAKPTAPTPIQQTVAKPPPMPDQPAQTPAQPAAPKGQARTNPG